MSEPGADATTLFEWVQAMRETGETEEHLPIPERFIRRGEFLPHDLGPTQEELELMLDLDDLFNEVTP